MTVSVGCIGKVSSRSCRVEVELEIEDRGGYRA